MGKLLQKYAEDKRRIIIYGPPKSRKTTTLSTLPKGVSLFVVDIDRQLQPLLEAWEKSGKNMKDIEWETVPVFPGDDGPRKRFEFLRDVMWDAPKGFDVYAIDSWTIGGVIITHEICGIVDREYNMRNNADLSATTTDLFWKFSDSVEKQGAWLISLWHEQWQEVDDGLTDPKDWRNKKRILCPVVASSAKITIPGQTDFVWHTEGGRGLVGKVSRSITLLRTRGTPTIMACTNGHDGKLKETEPADLSAVFKKLGLSWKSLSTTTTKPRNRNKGR